jgi:hypothetical protein
MNCEWTPDGDRFRCVHCNETRRVKVLRACIARKGERKPRPTPHQSAMDCPFLLDPIDRSVKVSNCGCGAMTKLFECRLYGDCAPLARSKRAAIAEPGVTMCRDCKLNPVNTSQETPPS